MGGLGRSDDEEGAGGLVGSLFMIILAPLAATIIQLAISRTREYGADAKGAEFCGNPLALAEALRKIEYYAKHRTLPEASPSTAHMFIINPFAGGGQMTPAEKLQDLINKDLQFLPFLQIVPQSSVPGQVAGATADQIDFKFTTSTSALWADLQANNLDVTYNLPQEALSTAGSVLGDRFINEPGMSISYEVYPTQIKAFQNRDVRVALAKAVDWAEISNKVYFDTRVAATSFAPSTIPGGGGDVCGDDCTYDPAAAKALLEKAGGIPGDKVAIGGLSNSENLGPKAECNFIQQSLGITCEVKLFEDFGAQLDAFNKLGPDDEGFILGLGWGADNPTLANMIAPLFGTGAGSNYTGYSNAEFDKLIAAGNTAADEQTAITNWQNAEKVLYADFAGHAIQWRNNVGGYSTNVSNVKVNPGGFYNVAEIVVNNAG